MPETKRKPPPLDLAALDRIALRYVERFATTRAHLAHYLARKIAERGWSGPPADPAALAARLADLGYVDDRVYAEAKARSMGRRGLGARRVAGAFRAAGIGEADAEALAPDIADRAIDAALVFARRRRIGPYGDTAPDRDRRERQVAAMVRAGHDVELARRIARMAPGEDAHELLAG